MDPREWSTEVKVVAVAAAATMAVGAYFVFASSASVLPSPVPAATSKAAEDKNAVPKVVVIFSGKRKSGKDYICERLHADLNKTHPASNALLRLSAPLKEQYANENNLDYQELLTASAYKEQHRLSMIKWGEEKREKDPGFFAKVTTKDAKEPIWIIPDARRPTDVKYFLDNFPGKVITVRVEADEAVRGKRGYTFTAGVDDAASECALDQWSPWTLTIANNGEAALLEKDLQALISSITAFL